MNEQGKPAFHSAFATVDCNQAIGCALLPFKPLKSKGSAPPSAEGAEDVVDEAISLFRANVMFSTFDVKSSADRLLVYLTLYVQQCLVRLDAKGKNKVEGQKIMIELARETFPLPGDAGWPLGGHFPTPKARPEADLARAYFKHIREEVGLRLCDQVYNADGTPNKFWMAFSKKKFMQIPMA